jgi:hypothetical protein
MILQTLQRLLSALSFLGSVNSRAHWFLRSSAE